MLKPYLFKAVLFDLDGVLIDTTALHYRVWSEFARARGIALSRGELLATNGRPANETIRIWLGSKLSDEQVAALTMERETYYHHLLETEPVPSVPGSREFVHALQRLDVLMAVVTSATPENARLSLSRVGLEKTFGVVITPMDVTRGKPNPEPYLKAAERIGVLPGDCLVIEDSVSGIRAAKGAKAKCLALATTFPKARLADESPDWLAHGFADIPPEIRP